MDILYLIVGLFALFTLLFVVFSLKNFRRRRKFKATFQLLVSLNLGLLFVMGGLLIFTSYGYQQLIYEENIAKIEVHKISPQNFSAKVIFADNTVRQYQLSGDEIYLDARILKWHPWANLLGLHTLYRLDRIGGRYTDYKDEVRKKRSLYALRSLQHTDLFDLRRKYPLLGWLVDAQYGSAAFIPIENTQQFQLSISNSGLVLRSKKE